jgi:hypothetical protein
MPDRNDFTPPPPEPLPGDRKRALRARLLAAADTPSVSPARSWLVPGLAAAAVLAIVAAGAYVASRDGDSGGPGSREEVPVGVTTTSTTSTTPSADSSRPVTPDPSTVPPTVTAAAPPATPSTAPGGGPGSCDKDIEQLGEPGLHGASVTAQRTTGPATTSLYETKSAWIVCDDLTASDGGAPTLFALHEKAQGYKPDVSTLKVSDNIITNPDGTVRYDQFVAAGRDFDGVRAISYVFPDGHIEDAVVGQNGLWSMNYLANGGLFLEPDTNLTTLDPIEVTVHYTSGDVRTFSLKWGLDTCAQINHGC